MKILKALVSVLIAAAAVGGIALAAGGELTPFRLIGPETSVQVKLPINISWGTASFPITITNNTTFYPGDKIAEVSVTIENISPNPYEVYFNAQVGTVKNNIWPSIEVKLLPQSQYGYASSLTLAPGEKKELLLEVKIAPYSQPAIFQGLSIFLNYGPPNTTGEKG